MIELSNVSKSFGNLKALENINCQIEEGSVFGLIGSNGSGKSTLLRLIAGIYQADKGEIQFDGEDIYENVKMKGRLFYISDDPYVFNGATMLDLANFYKQIYARFDMDFFQELSDKFNLETRRKLNTFSKGMQRQAHIILALASRPEILLCDETFDGLDAVVRQGIKVIFNEMVQNDHMTIIIASHNLREIEDICDHISLLHKCHLVVNESLENIQSNVFKVQCAFADELPEKELETLSPIYIERFGRMAFLTIRGSQEEVHEKMKEMKPLYYEILPLTLEEIFIAEMEVLGYDVKSFVF